MVKTRIITGLLLTFFLIGGMFIMQPDHFVLMFSGMMLIGAYEWANLSFVQSVWGKSLYTVLLGILFWFSLQLALSPIWILAPALLVWFVALIAVVTYKGDIALPLSSSPSSSLSSLSLLYNKPFRLFAGIFVLVPLLYSIDFLIHSQHGPFALLSMGLLISFADTGAFFVGRVFGKHKLAPLVSPGKSIEGVMGAVFFTLILSLYAMYALPIPYAKKPFVFLLAVTVVCFSILGDLLESLFKRTRGVKDSGKVLPGHGGVLDRLDSLSAGAPIFVLSYIWVFQ